MSNLSATVGSSLTAALDCCDPLMTAPLTAEQATDLAKAFKALGDPVRLRLLSMITSARDEICVCDLSAVFELTGPTISHHLKVLREVGLITGKRCGTWVYYRPAPDTLRRLSALLDAPDPAD